MKFKSSQISKGQELMLKLLCNYKFVKQTTLMKTGCNSIEVLCNRIRKLQFRGFNIRIAKIYNGTKARSPCIVYYLEQGCAK